MQCLIGLHCILVVCCVFSSLFVSQSRGKKCCGLNSHMCLCGLIWNLVVENCGNGKLSLVNLLNNDCASKL